MVSRACNVARGSAWRLLGRQPVVLWLTGLSAAGKSTIARATQCSLDALGYQCVVLDGDELRQGLCKGLGFSEQDRSENIRRVAEVARLFSANGTIVITALITPLHQHRQLARQVIGEAAFVEVYVDTPLSVAEARDPKGLYKLARAGQLQGFTGIDAAFEAPTNPHLRLRTTRSTCEQSVHALLGFLNIRGVVL